MASEDREGVLIARVVIEKYATDDGIEMYVDGEDGTGEGSGLALVDALGMLTYATHHTWDTVYEVDE